MVNTNLNPIGQKAKNLTLLSIKFPNLVPRFIIGRMEDIFLNWSNIKNELRQNANLFLDKKIPLVNYKHLLEKLVNSLQINNLYLEQLKKNADELKFTRVSYRTSASQEDLEQSSFAGQYLTSLDQDINLPTMKRCIGECAKSLFSTSVLEYLQTQGGSISTQDGCVIIQEMFYGEACGVLFTENGHNEISISYTFGWKNTTVEGSQSHNLSFDKTSSNSLSGFPKNLRQTFRKIIEASLVLEEQEAKPLDIEWSITYKAAALLQFRPITIPTKEYQIEWDNTNIAESYPGITLPLTYSFIKRLYTHVYPEFLKLLSISDTFLKSKSFIFENMLGYLQGRVYYNINNWYELVKLLPGYKYNKGFFEAMLMPAKKKPDENIKPQKLTLKGKIDLSVTTLRFILLLLRTDTLSKKFTNNYQNHYERYKSILWEYLTAEQIISTFSQIERDLLEQWAIPILNDFRTMVFHGLLRKLYFPNINHPGYVQLLSGIYDQTSIEPIRQLSILAEEIQLIIKKYSGNNDNLASDIEHKDEFTKIREKINQYLIDYGGRSPDELKLENPRLGESFSSFTTFLISTAKGYTKNTGLFKKQPKIKTILDEKSLGKSFFRKKLLKFLFPFILYQAKSGISKRERFRFYRAQVFGIARNAYLAMGNRFVEANLINQRDDIFYLTHSEIADIVLGHSFETSLKNKIENRKEGFRNFEKQNLGRRVTASNLIAPLNPITDQLSKKQYKKLTGLGVAKGMFTGKVIIVKEFNSQADVKGKILVTEHTDPGWTLLFLNASALIVERGNALSHASIVAREIGIPAVVAVEGACNMLRNNQKISVNGTTGEITML